MQNWQRHITLAFGLIFVLSGAANAYARAYMAGAHSIEICAELGNTQLTLGANGEALSSSAHHCDYCYKAVGVLSETPPHTARESAPSLARGSPLLPLPALGVWYVSTWPRGPPVLV